MKTELAYYAEYVDKDGKQHYAVHKYDMLTGFIWSMRDYKFPGLQYSKGKNNMEISNPTVTIDAKSKFDSNMHMHSPTKYWSVYDSAKRLIAKFRDKEDADEYKANGMDEYTVVEEGVK